MMEEERPQIDLNSIPCGFCQLRMDNAMSIVRANRFFYAVYGYTPESALDAGFTAVSFVNYPADWPACKAAVREGILTGRERFPVETKVIHRSGRILWIRAHCMPDPHCPDLLNCVVLDITEQTNTLARLQRGEEERRLLLQHTGRYVFRYYLATRLAVLSPDAAAELGMPSRVANCPEGVVSSGWCAPESAEDYLRFFGEMRAGAPSGSVVVRFRNHTGEYAWYSCAFSMVYGPDGVPQHTVVSFEDVSGQREKELAYEKWSQYNQSQMRDAVAYYECNLTRNLLEKVDGSSAVCFPADVLKSYDDVYRFVVDEMVWPEDHEKYEAYFRRPRLLEQYREGKREIVLECRRKDREGNPFWVLLTVQILPDPYSDDVKAFVLVKNIDQEKRRELELHARSQQDPLTGCLNRSAFVERVDAIFNAGPAGGTHALVMMDIDHFKNLNDTMGHQYGDQVLLEAAARLRRALRSQDLIGRLGGDEFVLCLRDMPADLDLEARSCDLCRSLCQAAEGWPPISASLGVSLFPRDGASFHELYQKADQALYQAKRRGRGCAVLYRPGLEWDGPTLPSTPIDPLKSVPVLPADKAAQEPGRQLERACYRTLLEMSGAVVIEYDTHTRAYYVSPSAGCYAFARNSGRDEHVFFLNPEYVHPNDLPLAEDISRAVHRGRSGIQAHIRLRLTSGGYRRCQVILTVLREGRETVFRSLISVRDADAAPESHGGLSV